jgi:hypothetical protein
MQEGSKSKVGNGGSVAHQKLGIRQEKAGVFGF